MSKIYLYPISIILTVIGFGVVFVHVLELRSTILAINANALVIEIDNGIAFIQIFIGCGALGLAFFKVLVSADATDLRPGKTMNR